MNEKYINALLLAVARQRDAALNDVAKLTAEAVMAKGELEAVRAELAALRGPAADPLPELPAA